VGDVHLPGCEWYALPLKKAVRGAEGLNFGVAAAVELELATFRFPEV